LPAYVASQVDDEKLEELLTSSDIPAEKLLDNWLTVAERFRQQRRAGDVGPLERSAALEKDCKESSRSASVRPAQITKRRSSKLGGGFGRRFFSIRSV
jgi:hypothetical protein